MTNARFRPNRSPILLPIRMKAAETSASSAIADWTPLAVVSRSWTTAEIDTFMSDVSTTSTNIAAASMIATRLSPLDSSTGAAVASRFTAESSELECGRKSSSGERDALRDQSDAEDEEQHRHHGVVVHG